MAAPPLAGLLVSRMGNMAKRPGTNPKNESGLLRRDLRGRLAALQPARAAGDPRWPRGDAPARGYLIEQDREIAERSGQPPLQIVSVRRVGAKPAKYEKV